MKKRDYSTSMIGLPPKSVHKHYIATLQVLIHAEDEAEACDGMSELMKNYDSFIADWSYLVIGGQIMGPTEKEIDDPLHYDEGEAFHGD